MVSKQRGLSSAVTTKTKAKAGAESAVQLDGNLASDPIAQSMKARMDKQGTEAVLTDKDVKEMKCKVYKAQTHSIQ